MEFPVYDRTISARSKRNAYTRVFLATVRPHCDHVLIPRSNRGRVFSVSSVRLGYRLPCAPGWLRRHQWKGLFGW